MWPLANIQIIILQYLYIWAIECPCDSSKYRLFIKTALLISYYHCWIVLIRDIKRLLKMIVIEFVTPLVLYRAHMEYRKNNWHKNTKSGKIWNRRLHSSYSVGLLPLCKILICWDLTDRLFDSLLQDNFRNFISVQIHTN